MQKITLEKIYHSYLSNGILGSLRLDLMMKEQRGYECFFTDLDTGEKKIQFIPMSNNHNINQKVEAIFCD
ncbi:MAG: hypothetical protein AAGI07_16820 [Bacteroidota bacterium]